MQQKEVAAVELEKYFWLEINMQFNRLVIFCNAQLFAYN